jgi:hypothetical protein
VGGGGEGRSTKKVDNKQLADTKFKLIFQQCARICFLCDKKEK